MKAERDEERNRAIALQAIADRSAVVTLQPEGAPELKATYGLDARIKLLAIEGEAIRRLLGPSWQTSRNLIDDGSGRLITQDGNEVMPVAGFTMLRKVAVELGAAAV